MGEVSQEVLSLQSEGTRDFPFRERFKVREA